MPNTPSTDTICESPSFGNGPRYGQRLLPHIIDEEAAINPDRVVGMYAKSAIIQDGFSKITMGELSSAINFTAWWIKERIGYGTNLETIAFIGIQDFRYWIMWMAAMKCGYPILLPSIGNSAANNEALLKNTACSKMFHTEDFNLKATELSEKLTEFCIFQIPSLEDMIHGASQHFFYTKTWEQAKNEPAIIVHTSGTTGAPKTITYTHSFLGTFDSSRFVPQDRGYSISNNQLLSGNQYIYNSVPLFHLGGLAFSISVIFYGGTLVLGPPELPANANVVIDIMGQIELNVMILVPSICEALVKGYGEEIKGRTKGLAILYYLGGPLSAFAGDYWTAHTPAQVTKIYGSTETAPLNFLVTERENWQFFEWHSTWGPDLELIDEEQGLYEVVINRRPSQAWNQAIFMVFPDLQQWRTNDLFFKHTSDSEKWIYAGRKDDLIVLSSGLKVNPLPLEDSVQRLKHTKGALVFGNGKTYCGLIVEPVTTEVDEEQLREEIRLTVNEMNAHLPVHAKVQQTMIRISDPSKPFLRAMKGTIQRAATVRKYQAEIEEMYDCLKYLPDGAGKVPNGVGTTNNERRH